MIVLKKKYKITKDVPIIYFTLSLSIKGLEPSLKVACEYKH